jgi:bzd-type benzoyl-CoA reductase N subunit
MASDLVNPAVRDWKASGKKTVGFFCSYVPEEILYAADVLPVRLRAPNCADTTSADVYMSHLNCTFMRSCLQFVLDGKYGFLDGMVFTNSCDHVRRLFDILREIRAKDYPLLYLIDVPHKIDSDLIAWYADELTAFGKSVQKSLGVEITEGKLRDAIEVYNEARGLLKQLYDLRKRESPPITGAEVLNVLLAGYSMPKDQYNQLLKRLLEELKYSEGIYNHRAKLMIAGSGGCDNPAYFKVIEDTGGLIVTDSLCFGSRSFWNPVETKGDLMPNLASSYLTRPSCPRMVDEVAERCNFVKQMVDEFKVDGVVFQRIRYCDLWGGQLLYLEKELKETGIPMLSLEREYAMGGVGQLRTRIQAFLERIKR